MDIVKILNEAGYKTVEGCEKVTEAIKSESAGQTQWLCSGYRVFPGGEKCPGCNDCNKI